MVIIGELMILRKLYIKTRLFLYSIRGILNRIAVILMIGTLIYLFIDMLIFRALIIGKADNYEINHKYKNAITFYNIAYPYYKFNHFSEENKTIYFELPYKLSMCYLEINNKKSSVQKMLDGLTTIQNEYGFFSSENAFFMRKYLITYFLINDNPKLGKLEFGNLITVYKKIGYSESIVPDLIRLKGDLYYEQGNTDAAITLYGQAYNKIITQQDIDYEVFANIVDKICAYEVEIDDINSAINIYLTSINTMKAAGETDSDITAKMFINLGDLYAKEDNSTKNAIKSYEEAIEIIKKLPRSNYLRENITTYLTTLQDLYNQDGQFHKVDEINVELTKQRRFAFIYQ